VSFETEAISIRRRWWANVLIALITPVFAAVFCFAVWGFPMALARHEWVAAAFLPPIAYVFGTGLLIALNSVFFYRVELDREELRMIGNFYTHRLLWSEIATIRPRSNYRIPGYHVEIQVDGSNNPRRHWSNFWMLGYFIHPLMERGGKDLTRYLLSKRAEWRRRQVD
jgi:hypothetical protein